MNLRQRVELAQETHRITKSLDRAITAMARMATKSAGLDPTLLGIHPHNAKVGQSSGKPWAGVDYDFVDFAQFLVRLSWLPGRIDSMLWELHELGAEDVPDSHKRYILKKIANNEYPWRIPTDD